MKTNRRLHIRYIPPPDTFAVLGKKSSRVGKVKEISLGGLSLGYVSDQTPLVDPRQVEIFLAGNGFHLSEVPCRLIYDVSNSRNPGKYDIPFLTKKCGIAFEDLTIKQNAKILNFIEAYRLGLY